MVQHSTIDIGLLSQCIVKQANGDLTWLTRAAVYFYGAG